MLPFQFDAAAQVFDTYPPAIRKRALHLRALIFDVAKKTPGVDRIEETLKWGEPAYIAYANPPTKRTTGEQRGPRFAAKERVIGSAIRIGWKASDPERIRLLFHCQTTLIDSFRERFAHEFAFEGSRAIVLERGTAFPEEALAACIVASLTYRL